MGGCLVSADAAASGAELLICAVRLPVAAHGGMRVPMARKVAA
jgi:hypothetical protein